MTEVQLLPPECQSLQGVDVSFTGRMKFKLLSLACQLWARQPARQGLQVPTHPVIESSSKRNSAEEAATRKFAAAASCSRPTETPTKAIEDMHVQAMGIS